MVRVRSIGLPQAGHEFVVIRLSPPMVAILTSQKDRAVMTITLQGFWREGLRKMLRTRAPPDRAGKSPSHPYSKAEVQRELKSSAEISTGAPQHHISAEGSLR
jgi:hypothetical protein